MAIFESIMNLVDSLPMIIYFGIWPTYISIVGPQTVSEKLNPMRQEMTTKASHIEAPHFLFYRNKKSMLRHIICWPTNCIGETVSHSMRNDSQSIKYQSIPLFVLQECEIYGRMDAMEGRLAIPVMIVQNFQDLFFVFQQLFLK